MNRLIGAGVVLACAALIGCGGGGQTTDTAPATTATTVEVEKGVTINLAQGSQTPDPNRAELQVSAGKDHCRWTNNTTEVRTIHFSNQWPFRDDEGNSVVLQPGETSSWYTVKAPVQREFSYSITPPLSTDTPPDEPSISVTP